MPPVTRHDAVLAAVPAPLLAGLVWAWVAGVGSTLAVGAGALVAVAPLAYGLFISPPN